MGRRRVPAVIGDVQLLWGYAKRQQRKSHSPHVLGVGFAELVGQGDSHVVDVDMIWRAVSVEIDLEGIRQFRGVSGKQRIMRDIHWKSRAINGDGIVDTKDSDLVVSKFGTNDPDSDVNMDGIVDIYDYNIVVTNFGKAWCP